MSQCPSCQHENREEAKFCEECGAKLRLVCASCGQELRPSARFCDECGAAVAPSATPVAERQAAPPRLEDMHTQMQRFIPAALNERMQVAAEQMAGENRLITALFADISGFTTLSNEYAPEQVVEIINQCFRVIVDAVYRYEGSINRFIGDNVLAFFGAPLAHENDPERALLAALQMRDQVAELGLQISVGVNAGFLYVGKIGVQEHEEYSAYGTEINLAKRLQEHAAPGQILVGSGAHRFTYRAFEFRAQEGLQFKGIETPVTGYELVRRAEQPQKLRGIEGLRSGLVGRESEFNVLMDVADEWLQGRGRILSLIGEAGLGKSRLVAELKTRLETRDTQLATRDPQLATRQPATILEGRCISIGQPISYWPFLDILRSWLDLKREESEVEIAAKLVERLDELFGERAEEYLPYFGHLLSVKFGNEWDTWLGRLQPEQLRHLMMMRLRDTFVAIAQKQPLLLILEDLHWADDLSLDLLTSLMDSLSSVSLMLLCVYRPEQEHRCWQLANVATRRCPDQYREITLKPLSSRESRQLVENLLSIDNLPDQVKTMILRRTEGNPFFIEEVIRSLIDRGLVVQEDGRWKARDEIRDVHVPETVQGVILERVDRLESEVKYVLQCASIIGRLFQHRLLSHLSRQSHQLDGHLAQLEHEELVYEERTVPELEYAFKHALTQEATYQGILEQRRRTFHLQVAQGIEMFYQERVEDYYEELAHHYQHSGVQEKALEYLLKAAEKSQKQYANEAAIDFYQRALEFMQGMGEEANSRRTDVYYALGRIHGMIGHPQESRDAYRSALAICTDRRMRARLHLALAGGEDELETIEAAQAELVDDPKSPEMALVYDALSSYHWEQGRGKDAMEWLQRGLDLVVGTEHYEEIVRLCGRMTWIGRWMLGGTGPVMRYAEICEDAAERSGNTRLTAQAEMVWIRLAYKDERYYQRLQENIRINKRIGNWGEVLHEYAWLHFNRDDPEVSLACLQEGYALMAQLRHEGVETTWEEWYQYAIGRIYMELHQPEEVERWYAQEMPEENRDANANLLVYGHLATAYWYKGHTQQAKDALQQAMRFLAEIPRNELGMLVRGTWAQHQWTWMLKGDWIKEGLFPAESLVLAEATTGGEIAPQAYQALARAYTLNGHYDDALTQFLRGYQDVPWVIGANERWEWVVELAQQAPLLDGWPAFWETLREKAQGYDEALASIEQAVAAWERAKGGANS